MSTEKSAITFAQGCNIKDLSDVKVNIKQIAILRWQYISTGTINIYVNMIKKLISIPLNLQTNLFGIDLLNNGPKYRGQLVNLRLQTPQGQSLTMSEIPLQNILFGMC